MVFDMPHKTVNSNVMLRLWCSTFCSSSWMCKPCQRARLCISPRKKSSEACSGLSEAQQVRVCHILAVVFLPTVNALGLARREGGYPNATEPQASFCLLTEVSISSSGKRPVIWAAQRYSYG